MKKRPNSLAARSESRLQPWRKGWAKEEIEAVPNEAKSKEYDHLLRALMEHSEDPKDKNH